MLAQNAPGEPYEGQPGKDVVWVPTPSAMVEQMLDLARVTSKDFVIDLGSGDGRNVIAAAKRGAQALGVEFDAELVALARRRATLAGVEDRASFVQGDMYEADISRATVLALFLLPHNLSKLMPRFLELPPGTRIVSNTYRIDGWDDVETVDTSDRFCITWCVAYLYLVPAKIAGTWQLPVGKITFEQKVQRLSGTLLAVDGREHRVEGTIKGERIRFTAGMDVFTGRVRGNEMTGEAEGAFGGFWRANRVR